MLDHYITQGIEEIDQEKLPDLLELKYQSLGDAQAELGKVADFRYDAQHNEYICPAGQRLTYRFDSVEHGKRLWVYETNQCSSCLLQSQCTTSHAKRIKRWEKEDILDAADALLKQNPDAMRPRKQLVEHPYGTIKHWMGSTHFLMKRLPNVQAEMSLHVLAYNLRRAINVSGVAKIMEQLQSA